MKLREICNKFKSAWYKTYDRIMYEKYENKDRREIEQKLQEDRKGFAKELVKEMVGNICEFLGIIVPSIKCSGIIINRVDTCMHTLELEAKSAYDSGDKNKARKYEYVAESVQAFSDIAHEVDDAVKAPFREISSEIKKTLE